MTAQWQIYGLGALLGAGLWFIVIVLDARTTVLVDRLRPHLEDRYGTKRGIPEGAGPAVGGLWLILSRMIGPSFQRIDSVVTRLGSSHESVQRRLLLARRDGGVSAFRLEQTICAAIALALVVGVSVIAALAGSISLVPAVILAAVAAVIGALLPDWRLSRRARRRQEVLISEFPTITELLALAVAAGEAPIAAIDRVVRLTESELTHELRQVLADVRTGSRLASALIAMGERVDVAAISRFTEGFAVAVERGTPLARVLHAQARDAREAEHHHLMEQGGKKEIAMMIPVIFLILPITILFALFPGLASLNISL